MVRLRRIEPVVPLRPLKKTISDFFFTGQRANGLNHCALDNEYEDDDEYEEERCIISYSCSSSSSITAFLRWLIVLCPTNKLQNDRHSRAGGSPVQRRLDSRLRGNDGWVARLRT
jgi:hypothetical protein